MQKKTVKEDIALVLKEELENGHGVDVAIDCLGGELGCCMYLCVHEHNELAKIAATFT